MKKLLLISICLIAIPVMAQRNNECALTPLQELIKTARDDQSIKELIARGVSFDEEVRCGGSLIQLAVRRGNPEVLRPILEQKRERANEVVSLESFPINGAPNKIPLILFAAHYAPNRYIMDLLVDAGAKLTETDEYGRNVIWYLKQNPVLSETDLQDELNQRLLYGGMMEQEERPLMEVPQQNVLNQNPNEAQRRNNTLVDE